MQRRDNVTFLMRKSLDPFRFVLIALSGWMNQQQLQLIDYLGEENRVLREQLGEKRLRFNDDQRRRLAARPRDWEERFSERWLRCQARDAAGLASPADRAEV